MTLYQVVLESVVLDDASNPQVNSFFYNVDDLIPTSVVAASLAAEFYSIVVDDAAGVKSIVGANTDFDRIVVTTPYSPSVLAISPIAVAGLRPGAQMPRFVAWQFKSERTRADIRAGFKRFGVVAEADTSGDIPTPSFLTALNTFAGVMSLILNPTDGVSSYNAVPVIVKRIPVVVGGETVGYRLPTSDVELEYSQAENWTYHSITTQNSRKR